VNIVFTVVVGLGSWDTRDVVMTEVVIHQENDEKYVNISIPVTKTCAVRRWLLRHYWNDGQWSSVVADTTSGFLVSGDTVIFKLDGLGIVQ